MTSGEIDGDNTVADRVWHRAVTLSGSADDEAAQLLPGVGLGPGDRALRDVLTFHGEVMNNGLLHAVETHADDDRFPLGRVVACQRLLDLDDLADVVERAERERRALDPGDVDAAGRLEARADAWSAAYDDEWLIARVERVVELRGGLFAPV